MEFTLTTATPHPKLAFSFPRQTFSGRKMTDLDCKLLIVMCIVEKVHFSGFSTSLALKSLWRGRYSIRSKCEEYKPKRKVKLKRKDSKMDLRNAIARYTSVWTL